MTRISETTEEKSSIAGGIVGDAIARDETTTAARSFTPSSDFVPPIIDGTKWKNLRPLYDALLRREIASPADLERLILDRSELDAAASEAGGNVYIQMTRHTDDESKKKAYLDFVEHVQPELRRVSFELDKKIAQSPHAIGLDPARYEVMFRDLRADVELFRPENIPLHTEDTKLGQQYAEICGAMTVEYEGEEYTLPQMARFLEENVRSIREQAWRASAERRHRDHEKLSAIFDQMIRIRHQIARNAGFDNYRDYVFKAKHRFDYGPAECEAFHDAVEQTCMPLCHQLNRERAAAMGLERLRPWDLSVDPRGRDRLRPFDGAEELVEKSSLLFHEMDAALGAMFDRLRQGDCLDLESRKGKAPGGYQYQRDRKREPFIFMNAAGLQRDLVTMLHEAGHAFHSMLSERDPLVHYRHAPIEFAEVASMSMELFSYPYLSHFYSDADAARAKRQHLEKLVQILPWVATIDAFQHWIYLNPEHTHAERRAKWEELEHRFGPEVDWTGHEHFRAVGWQRQLHLFEVPFYYIEYGIAQLGAMQLWLQAMRSEAKAVANYRKAMSLGGARPLPELFEAAELRFDFGAGTVRELMQAAKHELDALPV